MKMFIFKSSKKCDKLSNLTVFTDTYARAYCLALISMKKSGYKGEPIIIIKND